MLSYYSKTKAPSKIIGIQFSILSPEEIKKNAVVQITSKDTYVNGKPVIGGLFDPNMGVLDTGMICPTDGLDNKETPGYFGYIELARPVFFIQHIKDIMKISKCVCYKCSKLLIDKSEHKHVYNLSNEDKWDYVYKQASGIHRCGEKTSDGCGWKQPNKIKVDGMATIYALWSTLDNNDNNDRQESKIKLTPELLLKIFKRISDEDVAFMGFSPVWSRPEWMICTVLPVAPPAVRPSVRHDAQQRSEDDLTHIYCNIIKTNNDLINKLKENAASNAVEGLTTMLQYFVAMIVNNKVKGSEPMAQRTGRPLQCIMGRINTKYGRIRGNLMGKRVDFSARSVITGDPNLSIRQLGVPMKIAMTLTKPVIVNDRNKDYLMKLIQNGPDVYPGAKVVEKRGADPISLRNVDRSLIRIQNGDIVHRHMMDDDAVIFNRQPSLHRMSMMCHVAKIMKRSDPFRLNVGVTKPYNADFDGDEMNMHMPQNVLAETELRHLAAIPYQIISPTSNSPIIGIYQDSMLGSFQFTREKVAFSPKDAMILMMMFNQFNPEKWKGKTEITNFDILSQILPPLTLKYKNKLIDEATEDMATSNNVLEINNGKYIRGQIEKSVLGSSTKGIIHRIFNDFGNFAAANFIDDLQNIITEYMKTSSFSVGISDLMADYKTNSEIIQAITDKKIEVQSIINQLHLGTFRNTTTNTTHIEFERCVNNVLNQATEEASKIGRKSLSKENRFLKIVNSGSKGSLINISQMISCLGQQNVDGKRIPYGFDSRTLPHYNKYDDSPNARGFIENSYISGLTAPELFFHAMGGRIGLIDTAVKTSDTGYIQRRLIKGLEDLKVEYDMTVRNSKGKIIQFSYGDDSFDSTKVENQQIPLVEMSIEDIYTHYDIVGVHEKSEASMMAIYSKSTIQRIKSKRQETKAKCLQYIENMIQYRNEIVNNVFKYTNDNYIRMPVAFQNIIANIQGQLQLGANSTVDITPLETFDIIEEYFEKIKSIYYAPPTPLFKVMYFFYLTPRDLLIHKRFNEKALRYLLETIVAKYKDAIVHPGEMVGVIAGQSIGEPTTQLTLNTFHLAGVASKSNVTRGVPRIKEIMNISKNPKNPYLTVYLKPADELDRDKADTFANMMSYTKLIDLVKSAQICFDPSLKSTYILEDQLLLEQYYEFEDIMNECLDNTGEEDTNKQSKWIIRLELDEVALLDKNITTDDIHFAIQNSMFGDMVTCIYSDFNMDKLIFRIRANDNVFKLLKNKKGEVKSLDQSDDIYTLKTFQDKLLSNIILRGVNGIENVAPRKLKNKVVMEDSKFVKKEIWVLDTTGTNLLETLALDYIDSTRTYSNDIYEVFEVLGIEAARQVLYNEFVEVMEFSDVYINYHHLSVLCDRMTSTINMVPIFRTGILADDIGPISKSTFEMHTEVFLSAARHADFDDMRGVSAAVMTGQYGYYGTNSFNLVLDIKEMIKLDSATVNTVNENEEINNLFDLNASKDDGCSGDKTEIKTNIEFIQTKDMGKCNDDYELF